MSSTLARKKFMRVISHSSSLTLTKVLLIGTVTNNWASTFCPKSTIKTFYSVSIAVFDYVFVL